MINLKDVIIFLIFSLHDSRGFLLGNSPLKRRTSYSYTSLFTSKINVDSVGYTIDNNTTISNSATIAIVGAGVGGLSIACRIASSPDLPAFTKVIVLEKNSREMVGGRCGSFIRDVSGFGKFRFERGPSLLLLKNVYLDLFRECGKDPKDYNLRIEQCVPAYQVVFDDGDTIQLGFPNKINDHLDTVDVKRLERVSRQKMDHYEQNGSHKWNEYMRATEAFLDCGLPNFIEEVLDLKSFPSFLIEATRSGFKVKNKLID